MECDPADRRRPAWAARARESVRQALGAVRALRSARSRHGEKRQRAAVQTLPRSGGARRRAHGRHGAVRVQRPYARDLPRAARRGGIPPRARRRDRDAGLSPRLREGSAASDPLGEGARAAHRRAPRQRGVLGQRDGLGRAEKLAGAGFYGKGRGRRGAATDAAYERLSRLLLENYDIIDAAFGSHNLRSVAHAIATARALGVPENGYEIQMLFGMAEPVRRALVQSGRRVRVYVPVGELLPGMAYLIRRLMENTSNTSFLRQTYADGKDIAALIAAPAPKSPPQPRAARGGFVNEPPLNFSRHEDRARFAAALEEVEGRLGGEFPLWIAGDERKSDARIDSVDPAAPVEIVGRAFAATSKDVDDAISAAREFFPSWRAMPARERAEMLFRAAAIMRERRVELAVREVYEVD